MVPMVEHRGPRGSKLETVIVSLIGVVLLGTLWLWFLYQASER